MAYMNQTTPLRAVFSLWCAMHMQRIPYEQEGAMLRRTAVCALSLFMMFYFLSCTKLPDAPTKTEGRHAMEVAQLKGPIPLAWGSVVSVSSIGQFPGWVQVWFQDNDGNMYMIPYHVESNVFHENYRFLRRQ